MSALIRQALARRAAEGRPILTGVIGAGDFGLSLVCQISRAPGMRAAAVADLNVERALTAYAAAGIARDDVLVSRRWTVPARGRRPPPPPRPGRSPNHLRRP